MLDVQLIRADQVLTMRELERLCCMICCMISQSKSLLLEVLKHDGFCLELWTFGFMHQKPVSF